MEIVRNVGYLITLIFVVYELIRIHLIWNRLDKKIKEATSLNEMYNIFYEEEKD